MITYKGLLHLGFSKDDFVLQDDSDGKGVYIKEWRSDKPQPSAEEMKKANDFLQSEHTRLEYARKRKAEYDQLNQFELIGEDSINGTTNHKDAILAIKAKYPKE